MMYIIRSIMIMVLFVFLVVGIMYTFTAAHNEKKPVYHIKCYNGGNLVVDEPNMIKCGWAGWKKLGSSEMCVSYTSSMDCVYMRTQ